jgi:hypothetical protein
MKLIVTPLLLPSPHSVTAPVCHTSHPLYPPFTMPVICHTRRFTHPLFRVPVIPSTYHFLCPLFAALCPVHSLVLTTSLSPHLPFAMPRPHQSFISRHTSCLPHLLSATPVIPCACHWHPFTCSATPLAPYCFSIQYILKKSCI